MSENNHNESLSISPQDDPDAANVGVNFYPRHVWNRQKEILIGTRGKVSPNSTKTRRIFKMAKALGQKFALYSWMLNGIGCRDNLKFYIDHAAEQVGVNEKTVDRQLAALEQDGWITRRRNIHGGNRTYSTYVLNPINKIIGDDGHGPKLKHFREPRGGKTTRKQGPKRRVTDVPTRKDTNVPTKRAKKTGQESQASLPPSSSHPSGARHAEAGRAGQAPATATAGFATKGDIHAQNIQTWVMQNEEMFSTLGFKAQLPASLVKDILKYTDGDDERWIEFVSEIWPVLLEQCRASEWLSEGRCRVGFGWLFLKSKTNPDETNLDSFMLSQRYTDLTIPEKMFSPGERVIVWGQPTPKLVLGFKPASLTTYRLVAETITDPAEIEPNTIEVSCRLLSPAAKVAEGTVLASSGLSGVVAVVEEAEGRGRDEASRAAAEEDDELLRLWNEPE
ncbi:MAG TPA: hypothetical protein VF595_05940 [Tepidisphaeraceae bacterium]|jgi:hypothetical protein